MKKLFFLPIALLFVCGCHPTVSEYGIEYEALTEREQEALVALARVTLTHNSKRGIVSTEEARIARETEPDFRIRYTGDRQGTARVRWNMPTRWITIVFDGEFLEPQMNYVMQIEKKGPELIDMRKQKKQPEAAPPRSSQKTYRSIAAP